MCSWANPQTQAHGLLFGQEPKITGGTPAARLPVYAERVWTAGKTDTQNILQRLEPLLARPLLKPSAPATGSSSGPHPKASS